MWISICVTETMLNVRFIYMCLPIRLLMMLPGRHLPAFILTLEKSEQKVWMHIKLFLGSAKSKAVQEAHKLHCVDAAAADAKILSKWCLASLVYIFWAYYIWIFLRIFVPKSLERLCKTCTICLTLFIKSLNHRIRIFYSCQQNLLQIGNVDQELSLLVIKLTTLRGRPFDSEGGLALFGNKYSEPLNC